MANRGDTQFFYTPHDRSTLVDCTFVVDSTNGNGFGVRTLKNSARISSVFMKTSATPGKAANGLTNPNPANGYINVTLQDNYNTYLGGFSGSVSPVSGTPISISGGLTPGVVYVITSLGTSTQANWQVVGLPSYIQAAVGVSFVCTSATAGTGTGVVESTVYSALDHIEVIGDSNLMNSVGPNITGKGVGMTINMACYHGGALGAPANGAVIGLAFYLNNTAFGV